MEESKSDWCVAVCGESRTHGGWWGKTGNIRNVRLPITTKYLPGVDEILTPGWYTLFLFTKMQNVAVSASDKMKKNAS